VAALASCADKQRGPFMIHYRALYTLGKGEEAYLSINPLHPVVQHETTLLSLVIRAHDSCRF